MERRGRRGLALRFLDRYQPKGTRKKPEDERAGAPNEAALPGFVTSKVVEILPPTKTLPATVVASPHEPAPLALPPPPRAADVAPKLDAVVRNFNDLLQGAAGIYDLTEPEGFLDTWVCERPDHRLSVKIERSGRALELFENFAKTLDAAEHADAKIRTLNRAQQQEYIEELRLTRTALEEYYGVQHASAAAQRQEEIDAAKARTALALLERQVRDAASDLRAAPSALLLQPVDEATRRREEAKRKRQLMYDLRLDEIRAEGKHRDEKLDCAIKEIQVVFGDYSQMKSVRRARILQIIEVYGVDPSLLPTGVQELIKEEPEDDQAN